MGGTVYLPTWIVDFYGKCIDPMGYGGNLLKTGGVGWFLCFLIISQKKALKKSLMSHGILDSPRGLLDPQWLIGETVRDLLSSILSLEV